MLKGKRTFIFGAVIALLGTAQALDWTEVLTEQNAGIVVAGIGAVIVVLRAFTNTPPGASE